MKALEPVEIIASRDGGSYAYKTKLDWCIVGSIVSNKTGEVLRCNRIAVKDAITGKLLSHHFVKNPGYKMRDIGVEEMFRKIYQNDFCEEVHLSTRGILGDIEEISKDEKMFLAIVEKRTKKIDDHNEVSLPYEDGKLQLPNNKEQAIRRMQQVKTRFQKDPEFFNSYTKQIEELILKGYAKRSSSNSIKGKIWYLPYHGVKHASKPEKVRIVFDCSSIYAGISLKNKLLSGPDLTNQFAGVLIKCRTKEVAFMSEIEAMYYQVQVPKEQRSVLRFL